MPQAIARAGSKPAMTPTDFIVTVVAVPEWYRMVGETKDAGSPRRVASYEAWVCSSVILPTLVKHEQG